MLKETVFVQKMSANGDAAETHSGFFLENGMLVTAFEAIDGDNASSRETISKAVLSQNLNRAVFRLHQRP